MKQFTENSLHSVYRKQMAVSFNDNDCMTSRLKCALLSFLLAYLVLQILI